MGQTLHLGAPIVIEAYADRSPYGALFEDDGKVAYFYALDTRLGAQSVLDAVYVYNVTDVLNHPQPSYRTGEFVAHLATKKIRVSGKLVRRFCAHHGIARDMRPGRPRVRA